LQDSIETSEKESVSRGAKRAWFALLAIFAIVTLRLVLVLKGGPYQSLLMELPPFFVLSVQVLRCRAKKQAKSKKPLVLSLLWVFGITILLNKYPVTGGIVADLACYLSLVSLPFFLLGREHFWSQSALGTHAAGHTFLSVLLVGGSLTFGYLLTSIMSYDLRLSGSPLTSFVTDALLPGVFEEVLFRGLILSEMIDHLGNRLNAVTFTALLFGLNHIPAYGGLSSDTAMVAVYSALLYPTVGGLLYGAMTSLSKSTVPAIIMHISYNTWMILSAQGSFDILALPIGALIAVIGLAIWWFFDVYRADAGDRADPCA